MITATGLEQLGFTAEVDFKLQDDGTGNGIYIKEWLSSSEQPIESEIEAADAVYQTNWNAKEYARKRKAKYDALNQFELISDDAINGTTTHKDAILAIKSEFPKP